MGYDTLKEASWLIDEEIETQVRQKADSVNGLTPGEVFRKAVNNGIDNI